MESFVYLKTDNLSVFKVFQFLCDFFFFFCTFQTNDFTKENISSMFVKHLTNTIENKNWNEKNLKLIIQQSIDISYKEETKSQASYYKCKPL